MIDSFEIEGEWWLPDNPDYKVKGKVIYNPGQTPILKLSENIFGMFKIVGKIVSGPIYPPLEREIILGTSNKGEKVTLYNCFATETLFQFSVGIDKEEQTFTIMTIFKGEHFDNKDDIRFKVIILKYFYFDDWTKSYIRREGINTKYIEIDVEGDPKLYIVLQDNIELPINERINLKNVKNSITFYYNKSKNYFDINDDIRLMSMFFSFAIFKETQFLLLKGMTNNFSEVNIFHGIPDISSFSKIEERQFLFSLSGIHNNIEALIKNWFIKGKDFKLDIVFDLLLRTIYYPGMHYEVDFLLLAQTLETLHHRISYNKEKKKYDEYYVSDNNYKQIYKVLCKTLDNEIPKIDFKNSIDLKQYHKYLKPLLKAILEWGNRYSFKRRLEEIERKYKLNEVFYKKLSLSGNWNKFLRNIIDSRNYYTHWDEKIKKRGKVLSGADLYLLTQNLRIILKICIMKEIGFEDEEILTTRMDLF